MTNALTVKDNEDLFLPIQIDNDAQEIRLDDYDITIQIRRTLGAGEVLLEATAANGRLAITDSTAGEIELFIARADLQTTLGIGSCVFDVQLVDKSSGFAEATPTATLTIVRGVTRAAT